MLDRLEIYFFRPIYVSCGDGAMGITATKEATMTNVKINVKQTSVEINVKQMYVGFVCIYWSQDKMTLGRAKQKSLEQMRTYSNTIDKSNPVSNDVKSNVQNLSKSVSKQIMTSPSSEKVLDKKQSQKYRAFGEHQVATAKRALDAELNRGVAQRNQNQNVAQIKNAAQKSTEQNMLARQKSMQYKPTKTNVAEKPAQATTLQRLDQKKLLEMFAYNKYQKAA